MIEDVLRKIVSEELGKALTPTKSRQRRLLTREQAATYLGIGAKSLDRMRSDGDIQPVLLPGRGEKREDILRYDADDLDALIAAGKQRGTAA